jgi:DNA-binding MurR/RpiR family transcriptional regulator
MALGGTRLPELIARSGGVLSPAERRVARLIGDDPALAAFATVAEVARGAGTSGPTVIRFAVKLGFEGFSALQQHARQTLVDQVRRPSDRLKLQEGPAGPTQDAGPGPDGAGPGGWETDGSGSGGAGRARWDDRRRRAVASVAAVFDAVDAAAVRDTAEALAHAPGRLWVVCAETAAAPGQVLAAGLRLLRPGVRLVPAAPAAAAAELVDAGPGDVAVAIDFPRYERSVVDAAAALAARGARLIAITDSPLAPLAAPAERWFALDVGAAGPFDSALPVLALVEALVSDVAAQLHASAAARLDATEAGWAERQVYLPSPP